MRNALVLVLCAACSSGGGGKSKVKRDGGPAIVVVEGGGKGGPAAPEKEPNDEAGNAHALTPPTAVRGVIDKDGDRDTFVIVTDKPGTLVARLTGIEDADLILDLQDVTGIVVASADSGPANIAEGIPNYAVRAGTWRLVVREFVKRPKKGKPVPRAEASKPYILEVALDAPPAAGEEAEPNDDTAAAGELPLGGTARGFVGWRNDADVWKVPLDTAGDDDALSVDVDGVPGLNLRVTILDSTGQKLVERVGREGEPVAARNVAVKTGEPYYFVSVGAKKGNWQDQYIARVQTVPFELDEEAEPNDDPASAGPLADVPGAESGTRVGFLVRGDADLFVLDAADAPRRLSVTLEPPPGVDGEVGIVDDQGAFIGKPAGAARRGAAERLTDVPVPAGIKVFVRVTTKGGESSTERYRLRWSAVVDETAPLPGMEEE